MSIIAMEWVCQCKTGRASDKAVLVALANYHNQKRGNCCPGIDTISRFTELNRKTVMPALDRLMAAGFITFEKGSRRHRQYTLNLDIISPKTGIIKKADNSSNFGTIDKNLIVPKTAANSPKNGVLKSQPLDHEQENRITGITLVATPQAVSGKEAAIIDPRFERCAEAMWGKIKAVKVRGKKPDLKKWANDIRKLVEIDRVPLETVWSVFIWANADEFWRANIMCPQKLRKQFDQLYAKREQENGKRNQIATGGPGGATGGSRPRTLTPAQRTAAKREILRGRSAAGASYLGALAADE